MLFQFIFMFIELSRKLINQAVDSRVHVLPSALAWSSPVDVQGRIRDMRHFLHFQHNIDLVDPLEILLEFRKLSVYKIA